jgi:hypothetical protein
VAFCAGALSLAVAVLDVNKQRKVGAKSDMQKRPHVAVNPPSLTLMAG